MQDLSSPTRDQTHASCTISAEPWPLDHQASAYLPILSSNYFNLPFRLSSPSAECLASYYELNCALQKLFLKF